MTGIDLGESVGDYVIVGKLGQGGMGIVYLAQQESMDRKVALKILPEHFAAKERMLRRFKKEVRVLACLEHANIVTAFDAGEDNGLHYLAMSYVRGESLDMVVKRDGVMPEPDVLKVLQETVGALAFAWNEHRLVHRDLKPANLMRDEKGVIKLMDFGLGTSVEDEERTTVTGTVMGTPGYMSPEQVNGCKNLDFRSDIYALGCTAYHLATGRPPFDGGVIQVLAKQLQAKMPDPRETNPKLSDGFVALLQKMLAKRPMDRPNSYAALLSDIARITDGRSVVKTGGESETLLEISNDESAVHHSGHEISEPLPKASPQRNRISRWLLAAPAIAVVGIALHLMFSSARKRMPEPLPGESATGSLIQDNPLIYLSMDTPDGGAAGKLAGQVNTRGGLTTTKSPAGTGLLFDGIDDFVNLGSIELPENWTLTFWGRLDEANIYDKFFKFSDEGRGARVEAHIADPDTLMFWSTEGWSISVPVPQLSEWNFFALRVVGETADLCLNGRVRIASEAGFQEKVLSKTRKFCLLGAGVSNKSGAISDPSFLRGAMDEFRIVDRALSDKEIRHLASHP